MSTLREHIQDGQHQANLIAKQVRDLLNELPYVQCEVFKDELKMQLDKLFIKP